jgi:hypothetical protein
MAFMPVPPKPARPERTRPPAATASIVGFWHDLLNRSSSQNNFGVVGR